MNIKKILLNFVRDTSIVFTLVTVIYSALVVIVNVGIEDPAIALSWLFYIFLFSLLFALSQCIYRIGAINKALRVAIQYAIILFGSYVCFFLPKNFGGSQVMVGLAAVTVVYFLCFGIASFFAWKFKENTQKEETYEKQFKKKK